ncbi:porin [Shewanella frigidimarina]|jgi:predicted porin|uniref:Porin, Gram-negative type n=2 Tax=Shewanella TaxID=22 RepID=Q088F1_SHEFN|nr:MULTISPECIES: porin [Shewanella]BAF64730.1 porin [Shewanella livingstonensis]ABI70364.1 porin, Gram-negative type [Shewanella frigidimarina NCIMB 400]MBB1425976.1 porin [Shewanella sp. SG44-2]PKI01665.1 porin [Shewanella sp. 11B5]RPA60339.1 porin [Shewanella frigidimarina]|tara:strand:+ start:1697 stop:2740 length:1044 start_codon:yes stop_codon:yes gene_type:complete
MKKTLISASVASVLTLVSFATLAEGPSFYGRLDLAVSNSDQGATTQNRKEGTVLENNFSNLGVKGSEKFANGIELLYQMEFQVENTTQTEGKNGSDEVVFKARNTFLGLKSDAGTVLVGRNDTVFKQSEGGIDLFGNFNADIDRMIGGQLRKADGLWYYSPVIGGLVTLNATYLMEDNYTDDAGKESYDDQYALSATLGDKGLKAHPYYVAAAYNTIGGIDAYRGVAQVKLGEFKLGGLYQNTESQTSDQEGDSFFLNVSYNLNGVNLKAEYGQDEAGFGSYYKNIKEATGTDVNITQITVGADYRISKSTLVYGHYAMYEGDHKVGTATVDLEDDNIFTVGARYDF